MSELAHDRIRERIYVTRNIHYKLDSMSQVLFDILTITEAEGRAPFSITGGFVRNLMGNKPYNDFDISSIHTDDYRNTLFEMGLLQLPEYQPHKAKQHDKFMNPFDIGNSQSDIHWINTNEETGFPPLSFDFSVNEFALKSDKMIYGPTYAWRHWDSKIIKTNPRPNMIWTTNLILRAVRFSALLGFQIDKDDFAIMKKRLEESDVDTIRVIQGCRKIIEDGVEDQAMKILLVLEFPMTTIYKDIRSLRGFYEKKLISGDGYNEDDDEYHDMTGTIIELAGMPRAPRLPEVPRAPRLVRVEDDDPFA